MNWTFWLWTALAAGIFFYLVADAVAVILDIY